MSDSMELSLQELVRITGGRVLQQGAQDGFHGISSLDLAGPQDISFLGNAKYTTQFQQSRAGACLVAPDTVGAPETMTTIEVENPTMAFSAVIQHFAAKQHDMVPGIHPRAIVDATAVLNPEKVCIHAGAVVMAGAVIGDGTVIHPNAVIARDVVIGRDCLIYQNVSIRERCVLGDRVILQPGAVIGADGFGYEFSAGKHQKIPQVGIVEIGDDVEVGANTTIDRARFGKTLIGEGTKIDNLVQIGHNVQIGKHCLVIALTGVAGSSKMGNYVTCAAQVGVAGHLEIGDKAVLASRTGVTTNLPGGVVYLGNPAQPMKQELKIMAHQRRIPKLIEEVKELKRRIDQM
jgi:UDP-3-O-[3-hydroxymyristoyl] glucosamine N-acyltransferase